MSGLIDIAAVILAEAQQRVDISAQNIANMETPGYKRRVAFDALLASLPEVDDQEQRVASRTDFAQGGLAKTGSPLDLAISGPGFFMLRNSNGTSAEAANQVIYTRQGSFSRNGDGRLVRTDGYALQAASGGDVVLKPGSFLVANDGTVTQAGAEVARIALFQPDQPARLQAVSGGFAAPSDVAMDEVAAPTLHQGMLEGSNVSNGQEMVSIIEASRRAEAGQRIIQVYDELLGRVFGVLGGGQ